MAFALRDPSPAAAAPRPATPRDVLADRFRRLSPRQRAIWAAVILGLALVPALISASRPENVRSAVLLEPAAGQKAPTGVMANYLRSVVNVPIVQSRVAWSRSRYWDLIGLEHVDVDVQEAGPDGQGVRLTVADRTPRKARDLATAVAAEVVYQTRRAASRRASARGGVLFIDHALRNPNLSHARRAELITQRQLVATQAHQLRNAVEARISRPATMPAGDRIDRVVSKAAPGGVPRPNPIWAGLAGLFVGLALCALRLALPATRAPGDPPIAQR
jgi:hypothetical protein